MVDEASVFSWLNCYDRSRLGEKVYEHLRQVENFGLTFDQRQDAAVRMEAEVRNLEGQLERAEACVRLSNFWREQNQIDRAYKFLTDALDIYGGQPNQQHRQAVILWLLGCLEWQKHLNNQANKRWRDACEIFAKLALDCQDARQLERAIWYQDGVNQFQADLALTVEDACDWIYECSHSSLGEDLVALRRLIIDAVNTRNISSANALAHYMIDVAADRPLDEKADANLECGQLHYQMGNLESAIDLVKRAISLYPLHGHKHAVAVWVLGLLKWSRNPRDPEVLKHWTDSLECFTRLEVESNQRGNSKHAIWYRTRIEILARAKQQRISSLPNILSSTGIS